MYRPSLLPPHNPWVAARDAAWVPAVHEMPVVENKPLFPHATMALSHVLPPAGLFAVVAVVSKSSARRWRCSLRNRCRRPSGPGGSRWETLRPRRNLSTTTATSRDGAGSWLSPRRWLWIERTATRNGG